MAVSVILPQPVPSAALRHLADALAQTHCHAQAYGQPFGHALRRAVAHVEAGIAFEPYNATHYRVQSITHPWEWLYITLDSCSCHGSQPSMWCWPHALLHLLTAHAALLHLTSCPRPTLDYIPLRQPFDLTTIVRECMEWD